MWSLGNNGLPFHPTMHSRTYIRAGPSSPAGDSSAKEDDDAAFKVPLPIPFRGAKEPSPPSPSIAYIYSPQYLIAINKLPVHRGRDLLVQSLIEAYGLLDRMEVFAPEPAKRWDIEEFHSKEYTSKLLNPQVVEEFSSEEEESDVAGSCGEEEDEDLDVRSDDDDGERELENLMSTWMHEEDVSSSFGLSHDCPIFPGIRDYCTMMAGAAVEASRQLCTGRFDAVINWFGGRHHAKKDMAAGYCYVNDIVLSILHMMSKYSKILYVDFDAHHGDGVESAFYYTDRVVTLSFHHYSPPGYYPGTGSLSSIGKGHGKHYSINVPLRKGIGDDAYVTLVRKVLEQVNRRYRPAAVVLQCGSDCLGGDPLGAFNLTTRGLGRCVEVARTACPVPTLVLGGGGYHRANTARAMAYLTGILVGGTGRECAIPSDDIPEHVNLGCYGENGFQLHTKALPAMKDENSVEYLGRVWETVSKNISQLQS